VSADWEEQLADVWAALDELDEEAFLARIDALTGERGDDDAIALFERGAARDSTGHSDLALPLYRRALELGLEGERRRRAVIQMASSLRNLGRAEESVALLTAERDTGSDALDDAVAVFLALALADVGREREALALALAALAPHLPRYQRSAANYARELATTSLRRPSS
jgi:tetratricopeptide (TPR) repeat protein